MDHGSGSEHRELSERRRKKVKAEVLEFLEWNFNHQEHIPFYEKLALTGRETPLLTRPELSVEGHEVWQMYCFTTSNESLLANMDIFDRRVGLPLGWEFEECVQVISVMQNHWYELRKAKSKDD